MSSQGKALPPLMRHYLEAKEQYPDALLIYRVGDFYELFFEDAVTASRALDLTLTSRDKNSESPIPMCGVPHHAVDGYVKKLLEQGYKVAVCNQMEDPKTAKGMVRREVVRVVTPGLNIEEDFEGNNYLCAIYPKYGDNASVGLAFLDLSTGEFLATQTSAPEEALSQIARRSAREAILPVAHDALAGRIKSLLPRAVVTKRDAATFERAETTLKRHFGATTVEGFGLAGKDAAACACAGAIAYMLETQKAAVAHVEGIRYFEESAFMSVDENARDHLELLPGPRSEKRHTLLGTLDYTQTKAGARLLGQWIMYPLVGVGAIEDRLDAVGALFSASAAREEIEKGLKGLSDLERLLSRLSLGKGNGRDMLALLEIFKRLPYITQTLAQFDAHELRDITQMLAPPQQLRDEIEAAICDDPPFTITEGGIFKKGYDARLDELIDLATNGKQAVMRIEAEERARSGISSLKVRYNKVFGYYIEITKANLDKTPQNYIRKQTIAGGERYITEELKDFEEKILGAEEKRKALESELFEALRQKTLSQMSALKRIARGLATLDVYNALATAAAKHNYIRPLVDSSCELAIEAGRHPVVERNLTEDRFVPNDLTINGGDERLIIITGPNMAGKSTVMRQAALITIMAQMGSFVPAKSARVGVVDRIFTRIGAGDMISRAKSTFLVEMEETARILNQSTSRSLILLDEIGRGTSTFDGVSIAWAVAEYIHDKIGARTMFATHYHELSQLELVCAGVKNFNVAVKEWDGKIIFLRRLVRGGANHSYGIDVAKMAALPKSVVERAREILKDLEAHSMTPPGVKASDEPPAPFAPRKRKGPAPRYEPSLFDWAAQKLAQPSEVEAELAATDVETLSPLEALNLLAKLKKLVKK